MPMACAHRSQRGGRSTWGRSPRWKRRYPRLWGSPSMLASQAWQRCVARAPSPFVVGSTGGTLARHAPPSTRSRGLGGADWSARRPRPDGASLLVVAIAATRGRGPPPLRRRHGLRPRRLLRVRRGLRVHRRLRARRLRVHGRRGLRAHRRRLRVHRRSSARRDRLHDGRGWPRHGDATRPRVDRRRRSALRTPVAAVVDDAPVGAPLRRRRRPHVAGARRRPVSVDPHPAAVPLPVAGDPHVAGRRRRGAHRDGGAERRRGLVHDHLGWLDPRDDVHAPRHAAGERHERDARDDHEESIHRGLPSRPPNAGRTSV